MFEEIGDMKEGNIDNKMLLSETNGKPKEIYESLSNISSSSILISFIGNDQKGKA